MHLNEKLLSHNHLVRRLGNYLDNRRFVGQRNHSTDDVLLSFHWDRDGLSGGDLFGLPGRVVQRIAESKEEGDFFGLHPLESLELYGEHGVVFGCLVVPVGALILTLANELHLAVDAHVVVKVKLGILQHLVWLDLEALDLNRNSHIHDDSVFLVINSVGSDGIGDCCLLLHLNLEGTCECLAIRGDLGVGGVSDGEFDLLSEALRLIGNRGKQWYCLKVAFVAK